MLNINLLLALLFMLLGWFNLLPDAVPSIERAWLKVDTVSFTLGGEASGEWNLEIVGKYSDICGLELHKELARYPENIDIQLYHEGIPNSTCASEEAFNISLTLTAEMTDGQPRFLIINDQAWAIPYDGITDGEGFEELLLLSAHIDEAELQMVDGATERQELRIRGSQAVGCDLAVIYSRRESEEGTLIGVFNAIAADAFCPDMLVEIDETIGLPATELPADALLRVNNAIINQLGMPNMSQIDKVLTNIHSVDVRILEIAPPRILLDVSGEHPDGCDYPVQVSQSREGNTVTVEVYRELPADVFCPMILKPYQDTISLDGRFEGGRYTINVNTHSQSVDIS